MQTLRAEIGAAARSGASFIPQFSTAGCENVFEGVSTDTEAPGLDLLSSILFDREDTQDMEISDEGSISKYEPSSPSLVLNLTDSVLTSSFPRKFVVSTCSMVRKDRVYIEDDIKQDDILCGRGGRSNNHPGNKRYRRVVNEFRVTYQKSETKTVKTDLSRTIVEHCCSYGARFLKTDGTDGRYFVLTKSEARKKTSQALRETKDLKWTAQLADNQV
jgi:hypothetical protein